MTSQTTVPSPDDINTMFTNACEYQARQEYNKAKSLYLSMLEHVDGPLLRYNLGLLYYDLKEYNKANDQFEIGITMQPEDTDMLFNLAISRKASGNIDAAIVCYTNILELDAGHIDALYNIAGCHREKGETESAIKYYEMVLQLDPNNSSATNNLAFTCHLAGDMEKALHYYKKLLTLRPGHKPAEHMVAALEGNTPTQPPDEYVMDVFDNYSETYEESLTKKLHYTVPEKLLATLNTLPELPSKFKLGIDLGCGTGLSGIPFSTIVHELHGIDLSPKMIDLAKKKNIYTMLQAGNILDILRKRVDTSLYDLVLAADVFTYIGELREIFEIAGLCSSQAALFCFSTEKANTGKYVLRPSGRYAHSTHYIKQLLAENSWELLACKNEGLRKEKGDWVNGNLWIARRVS
jgi:predicted TPR repeat methyltransferase